MTQHIPKEITEEVNVTKVSPWREFAELLIKLAAAVLIIYLILGWCIDLIVPRISFEAEIKMARMFDKHFDNESPSLEEQKVQAILDGLVNHASDQLAAVKFRVHINEDKDVVNAFALPGGNIVLFRGLLNEIKSENELAMILGHELGHYAFRDHLRGLGRGLVFYVLVSFVAGTDSQLAQFFGNSLGAVEMKFSQTQEQRADQFGLDLLQKTYLHVAGATDFFERLSAKEELPQFVYFLASHPHPEKRVVKIKEMIESRNWTLGEKIEWIEVEKRQKD